MTDIAAGNSAALYLGLDLIDMGTDKFGSNGLLMDIYQLIDADPELSRDDFWLLDALERDGRLYRVMGEFAIDTYYGFTDTVGDRYGWTWDEYFAMQDALPDGAQMLGYRPADMFIRNSGDVDDHAGDVCRGGENLWTAHKLYRLADARRRLRQFRCRPDAHLCYKRADEVPGGLLGVCKIYPDAERWLGDVHV